MMNYLGLKQDVLLGAYMKKRIIAFILAISLVGSSLFGGLGLQEARAQGLDAAVVKVSFLDGAGSNLEVFHQLNPSVEARVVPKIILSIKKLLTWSNPTMVNEMRMLMGSTTAHVLNRNMTTVRNALNGMVNNRPTHHLANREVVYNTVLRALRNAGVSQRDAHGVAHGIRHLVP